MATPAFPTTGRERLDAALDRVTERIRQEQELARRRREDLERRRRQEEDEEAGE
jgi:hypothetical protein